MVTILKRVFAYFTISSAMTDLDKLIKIKDAIDRYTRLSNEAFYEVEDVKNASDTIKKLTTDTLEEIKEIVQ